MKNEVELSKLCEGRSPEASDSESRSSEAVSLFIQVVSGLYWLLALPVRCYDRFQDFASGCSQKQYFGPLAVRFYGALMFCARVFFSALMFCARGFRGAQNGSKTAPKRSRNG